MAAPGQARRARAYQRKVLLRYRCHPDSLSSVDPVGKFVRQLSLFEKIGETHDLNAEERAELDRVFKRLRAGMEFEIGKARFVEGDFAEARRRLKTANGLRRSWKVSAILLLTRLSPRLLRRLYLRRMGKTAAPGGNPAHWAFRNICAAGNYLIDTARLLMYS